MKSPKIMFANAVVLGLMGSMAQAQDTNYTTAHDGETLSTLGFVSEEKGGREPRDPSLYYPEVSVTQTLKTNILLAKGHAYVGIHVQGHQGYKTESECDDGVNAIGAEIKQHMKDVDGDSIVSLFLQGQCPQGAMAQAMQQRFDQMREKAGYQLKSNRGVGLQAYETLSGSATGFLEVRGFKPVNP